MNKRCRWIRVSDRIYQRLVELGRKNESFSNVISRILEERASQDRLKGSQQTGPQDQGGCDFE